VGYGDEEKDGEDEGWEKASPRLVILRSFHHNSRPWSETIDGDLGIYLSTDYETV